MVKKLRKRTFVGHTFWHKNNSILILKIKFFGRQLFWPKIGVSQKGSKDKINNDARLTPCAPIHSKQYPWNYPLEGVQLFLQNYPPSRDNGQHP